MVVVVLIDDTCRGFQIMNYGVETRLLRLVVTRLKRCEIWFGAECRILAWKREQTAD